MYEGSNIEKEYKDNEVAIDGCRVAKRAYEKKELNDIDYAFIAFGHNDQYFQPPLDNLEHNIDEISNCLSFKNSYRYIVSLLRKANPNIKIIIMNCTYSEYAARSNQWEHVLTYNDYRKAIKEISDELDTFYIDPWDYMKTVFDGKTSRKYYYDDVHISPLGHQYLTKFIINQ